MLAEPRWLPAEIVIRINEKEVAETGEPHFLRDRGLLESAIARAQSMWHFGTESDVVRLAVAILAGLAQNHAFEQGNKRTALTAALVFIEVNGYRFNGEDTEDLGLWLEALIVRDIDEQELASRLRPLVAPANVDISELVKETTA